MKSSQTMTTKELYHIGACDYDLVYMSQHACECAHLAKGCTLAKTEAGVTARTLMMSMVFTLDTVLVKIKLNFFNRRHL